MKIYIVTFEPFPHGMAATNRILHYGRGLVAAHTDCEVVIGQRTEFYSRVRNTEAKGLYKGVPFIYPSGHIYRSKSFLKRRLDDIIDFFILLLYLLRNLKVGDRVLLYSSRSFFTILLQLICRAKGVKIAKELCELPFATSNDSRLNRARRAILEKYIFPRFDGVIAISNALQDYAMQMVDASKIIKVPILIDTHAYDDIVAHEHPRPYIFHGGTMYERKDAIVSTMKAYIKAMNSLETPIDFILAGPQSPHHDELNEMLRQSNLQDRVHFMGQLSHREVLAHQKGAWLSILNKNDNPQNRCGFSTKLGDILLAGTPVVTTTVGEANFYLEDGVNAYITHPHDPDAIASQIIRAASNESERQAIGNGGQQVACKCFDYKQQGLRLAAFLQHDMQ